jgi:hypothetical protein
MTWQTHYPALMVVTLEKNDLNPVLESRVRPKRTLREHRVYRPVFFVLDPAKWTTVLQVCWSFRHRSRSRVSVVFDTLAMDSVLEILTQEFGFCCTQRYDSVSPGMPSNRNRHPHPAFLLSSSYFKVWSEADGVHHSRLGIGCIPRFWNSS